MDGICRSVFNPERTSSNQTGKMLPRRLPGSGLVYIKSKYSKFIANPPFAVLYPLPASWPSIMYYLCVFYSSYGIMHTGATLALYVS